VLRESGATEASCSVPGLAGWVVIDPQGRDGTSSSFFTDLVDCLVSRKSDGKQLDSLLELHIIVAPT
jgi:hypothetical protein